MSGSKPEVKIAIKRAGGDGARIDLLAYWRGPTGQLRGSLDRRVRSIRVELDSGETVTLEKGPKGYVEGWYINAFIDGPGESRPAARAPSRQTALPDDDDGIPF